MNNEKEVLRLKNQSEKDATVIIRADRNAKTGFVQRVIKLCQEVGFEKFTLRAKSEVGIPTAGTNCSRRSPITLPRGGRDPRLVPGYWDHMAISIKKRGLPDKIPLDMTPMIDVVFQLLTFFCMTLKIAAMEGDFNIKMPLAARGKARPIPISCRR